jgi:hypothetical protein
MLTIIPNRKEEVKPSDLGIDGIPAIFFYVYFIQDIGVTEPGIVFFNPDHPSIATLFYEIDHSHGIHLEELGRQEREESLARGFNGDDCTRLIEALEKQETVTFD